MAGIARSFHFTLTLLEVYASGTGAASSSSMVARIPPSI
jgi:hypothetical protein